MLWKKLLAPGEEGNAVLLILNMACNNTTV